jgi:hypothetical protein
MFDGQAKTPLRWGILAFLFCLAVYILRLDSIAGLFHDDAWYILLGKALATGQGFTLINSPSAGILPSYPPAFPALLSLIFRLQPNFPANLWLLKLPSIISLCLSGILVYYYLVRVHKMSWQLALAISLATMLTPALVFLATSTLMSEIFFMFLQMATLVLAEKSLRTMNKKMGWLMLILAAGFGSIAFLTRSIAVGLVAAIAVYYLLKKRFAFALAFSLLVCLLVGPWLVYKKRHAPTPAQVFEQKGYIMQDYATQFWQRMAGDEYSGTITYRGLPMRMLRNLWEVLGREVGGFLAPVLYRTPPESEMESFGMTGMMGMATDSMIISSILSAFCVIGLVIVIRERLTLSELAFLFTLPIVLSWGWAPFRFLMPFIPFIILYFAVGINGVWRWISSLLGLAKPESKAHQYGSFSAPVRVILVCIVLLNVYDHANYILGKFHLMSEPPVLRAMMNDDLELMNWMRANLEPSAIVATENPGFVYLHTGLKTVTTVTPARKEELLSKNVKYIAHVTTFFEPPVSPVEEKENILYETKNLHFFVYRLK